MNPSDDQIDELSDVISRHPAGSWPSFDVEERPPGPGMPLDDWLAARGAVERPPPGEPSGYWYQVGAGGLFYWQLAALAAAGVLLVMSDGGGRRRR